MSDPTQRFTGRVESYARYRPSYPQAVLDLLAAECGLTSASVVADVGSGTGLLSELFLENSNRVLGIEPNEEMRAAGERLLRDYPRFTSVAGTAEATTPAWTSSQRARRFTGSTPNGPGQSSPVSSSPQDGWCSYGTCGEKARRRSSRRTNDFWKLTERTAARSSSGERVMRWPAPSSARSKRRLSTTNRSSTSMG